MRLNLTERLPACIRAVRTHHKGSYFVILHHFVSRERPAAVSNNEGMHSERGCRRRWNGSALRAREGEFRCSLGFGCRPPP
jgi:hypothetical protein